MKKVYLVLCVFLMVSCDDTNKKKNNNNAQTEICDNGVDDDGDGLVDCEDPDCFGEPHCLPAECSASWVYWRAPEVCPEGSVCAFTGGYHWETGHEAACQPASQFSAGEYNGPCGPNGECPKGSACLQYYYGIEPLCLVVCSEDEHWGNLCPDDMTCSFQGSNYYPIRWEPEHPVNICADVDECDPVDGTGCPDGQGCYLISMDFDRVKCLPAGRKTRGTFCIYPNDCVPGHYCMVDGGWCDKLCNANENRGCAEGENCSRSPATPPGYGRCSGGSL